ncbi:MAG: hypothetical protein AB8G16_19740 [Gammaproteobacteria bacterium]
MKDTVFISKTVRDDVLSRYAELVGPATDLFSDEPDSESAFGYALELYLCALPNLGVSLDGFSHLRIARETGDYLRAVGLSHVLPRGQVPMEVELSKVGGAIHYKILVGKDDAEWVALSESKRWKMVYLYATGCGDARWHWNAEISGVFGMDGAR